jgi:hypothetical protein
VARCLEVDYAFFNDEDNLALDRPLPEKLALLWRALALGLCDQLCYLSSRPVAMWYGTATWLRQHGYPCPYHVLLRRPFLRTVDFKRAELETIARSARQVWFIDDSAAVREAALGLERVAVYSSIEAFFTGRARQP